jgi:hypothetical protein
MAYKAFPIYDLRSGLQLDREPWLIPVDAFQQAENVYFYNGRIYKRKGYTPFATGTGGTGVNSLASPPVMGIYEYHVTGGSSFLIAFDTDYLYQYNPLNNNWEGKAGYTTSTPDWTGGDDDFFWTEIWKNLLFITNNVDNIKYWDGSVLTPLTGTGAPDACLFLIAHKNRLIAFNTQEGGSRYPQRARFSNVGSYSNWSDDIYADADTVDWITGVSFIRGELLIFFERSVWWLRYTGDADTPFAWKKIAGTEGCYAPYSVIDFENEAVALGPTSWIGCDGLQVYNVDEKIPDLILTMNPEKIDYAYGFLAEELRQYLCSYASQGHDYPDKMLCLNYVDNCFSLYTLPMHVAGYWMQANDWTFDDVTVTMDEMTWSFDEKTLSAGYPITLMGDRSGYIHKLFVNDDDNGSAIASSIKTKRLIPYQGHKAKLGYLDIIGESGSQINITVKLYKDYDPTPYLTKPINMYAAGKEKVRKRVRIMEKGERHYIEICDNAKANPWVIDAIIPWFKKAGRAT